MDRTGQTLLGKYELTRLMGKGGMGEVWEGEHQLTGRRVAVKVLSDNYLSNRKVMARFGREARAASSVHHDGIVEILDQDKTQDGVPFLVMEFLEGESVGARIKRRGRLSQAEALALMLPLLDALDAAHRAGVVHRDLKPDNVFILPAVRGVEPIKILDFGISQKADEIEHHLTQEGAVLGTPHYMSPEQARGESGVDARADIYSAGVLLYECVVGDVPFDAGNYNALLQIILSKPPQSPRARGAQISGQVEQVLLATLHKDKRKRPESARALHDILQEASTQPEDATLDTESFSFRRNAPSAPASAAGQGSSPSKPAFSLDGPPSGVRRAPEGEGKSPRESGEFDFATPAASDDTSAARGASCARAGRPTTPACVQQASAAAAGRCTTLRSRARGRASTSHPGARAAGASPAWSLHRPRSAVAPARRGAAREHRACAGPLVAGSVARGGGLAAPAQPGESPVARANQPAPARAKKARVEEPEESEPEGPSGLARFGRALAGWVLALVAMAALGYVATLVFNRPDPRKARRTPSSQGLGSESTP